MTRSVCYCSVNEDSRGDKCAFLLLAENGYDDKNGFKALDKVIEVFWASVDPELLRKKLSDYQFSGALRSEFEAVLV